MARGRCRRTGLVLLSKRQCCCAKESDESYWATVVECFVTFCAIADCTEWLQIFDAIRTACDERNNVINGYCFNGTASQAFVAEPVEHRFPFRLCVVAFGLLSALRVLSYALAGSFGICPLPSAKIFVRARTVRSVPFPAILVEPFAMFGAILGPSFRYSFAIGFVIALQPFDTLRRLISPPIPISTQISVTLPIFFRRCLFWFWICLILCSAHPIDFIFAQCKVLSPSLICFFASGFAIGRIAIAAVRLLSVGTLFIVAEQIHRLRLFAFRAIFHVRTTHPSQPAPLRDSWSFVASSGGSGLQ